MPSTTAGKIEQQEQEAGRSQPGCLESSHIRTEKGCRGVGSDQEVAGYPAEEMNLTFIWRATDKGLGCGWCQ